jgi:hypothetical protein
MKQEIIEKYVKTNKIAPLDLTNEHIAKLYVMCNNIIDNKTPFSIYYENDFIYIPIQDSNKKKYTKIHWHEVCTTHLSYHLCGDPLRFLEHCIEYTMVQDKKNYKHPIDILWKEYQQIKQIFKDTFNNIKW